MPPDVRFFTPAEEAIATALCDQLLDLGEGATVPVVNLIDARLAEQETDGWHYEGMPEDGRHGGSRSLPWTWMRPPGMAAGSPKAPRSTRSS